ncbi:hypothetical protein DL95DRAFT_388516, partial [Leptodontidium sp. 2 PMI_412]
MAITWLDSLDYPRAVKLLLQILLFPLNLFASWITYWPPEPSPWNPPPGCNDYLDAIRTTNGWADWRWVIVATICFAGVSVMMMWIFTKAAIAALARDAKRFRKLLQEKTGEELDISLTQYLEIAHAVMEAEER